MVNRVHAEAPRALQVQRAVINEKALLRRALGDFQRDAKDGLLRLAGPNVTGTEENQKIPPKVKGFNAVLIELQRLIIDGADKVFPGAGNQIEDGARVRVFLGLREHERSELLATEGALAVKQSSVKIFVQGDLTGVESRKRELVAVLKFLPVQMEGVGGVLARAAIPTVGQDDATDVPEKCGDFSQGRNASEFWDLLAAVPLDEREREEV